MEKKETLEQRVESLERDLRNDEINIIDRLTRLEAIVDARNVWIAPEPWHSKTSMKDGYGIWRHRDGRMDFNKYEFVDGHMVEKTLEGENSCVEDNMTHDEYVEHKYEQHAQKQRDELGTSNRDIEEEMLNRHQGESNVE